MSSRRVQAWVWWLLPLLVARSLIPVGFMAQMLDGRMQIVFCQAGMVQMHAVSETDISGAPEQAHDAATSVGQNSFSCPFAHAAAAPLLDVSSSEAIAFIPQAEVLPQPESPLPAVGPPRFIATRGPPYHA